MIIVKTKSQLRAETDAQIQQFLRSGGTIEVVKSRKAPKQRMVCRATKQASVGTSGFATGFPRKSGI